jgi:hypothetical protein
MHAIGRVVVKVPVSPPHFLSAPRNNKLRTSSVEDRLEFLLDCFGFQFIKRKKIQVQFAVMILRLTLLPILSLFTVGNSFRLGRVGSRRYLGSMQRNEGSYVSSDTIHTKVRIFRSKNLILKATLNNSNSPPTSLKSAAIPLLDAGKALARAGELLIDITTELNLYGGALSAVGAGMRNAGDNIAQAAASCRFKTANELVIDELREAALALSESTSKLQLAIDEAKTDENVELAARIGTCCVCLSLFLLSQYSLLMLFHKDPMVQHMQGCSAALETSGAALMQRKPLPVFGKQLILAGQELAVLSPLIQSLPNKDGGSSAIAIAKEAGQRCQYASAQMILAGTNLCPSAAEANAVPTIGKGWLKGSV